MKKGWILVPAVAAWFIAATAGCHKTDGKIEAPSPPVARVGEREITAADVSRELFPQGRSAGAKVDAALAGRVLDQLIERQVILAWCEKNGVQVGDKDVNARIALIEADYGARGFESYLKTQNLTTDAFRAKVRDDLAVESAVETAVVEKISVSYEDVVSYYDLHIAEYETPAEFHIRQIITDTKEKAEEARAKIEYGAVFEEVAREVSMSPDRHLGGDAGYVPLNALPAEVAAVVEKLPPGQISPIISCPYGFEIVQVISIRQNRRKPLAEVRTEIENRLRSEREAKVYAEWVKSLRAAVKVSVDEKALASL